MLLDSDDCFRPPRPASQSVLIEPLPTSAPSDRLARSSRWPRTCLMVERFREKLTTDELKNWFDRMPKEMEQEAERDA